jgi:four helix bundle protein
LSVMELVESFPRTKAADIVARQMLRSATSIGANYRSARRARSRADFISKMAIALEEADESQYWLELALESGIAGKESSCSLLDEANELSAILMSSIKTARRGKK